MIYYTGLLLYIFIIYFFISNIKNRKKGKKIFFVLVCLGVILFQGFRDFSVGTDLVGYIPSYLKIGNMDVSSLKYQNYEKGYIILNKVIFLLGCDERQFLIIIAAVIQIPIFFTIYKYSERYLMSILWYFAFGNFIMTFSGLRQAIAMSIVFSGYYFIKNKRKYKFIMLIIFAALFHKSVLFCLVLYPLYYTKINRKKIIFVFSFLILLFIFKNKVLFIVSKLYYGKSSEITSTGAYTMLIIYFFLYVLSLCSKRRDKDYQGLRNMLLLLTTIFVFAPIHNYITRIGYPITLYMTIFIPKLVNSIKVRPQFIYIGGISLITIMCFYYFLGGLNTLPFQFG